MRRFLIIAATAVAVSSAAPAPAQLLGRGGLLPGGPPLPVQPLLDDPLRPVGQIGATAEGTLASVRPLTGAALMQLRSRTAADLIRRFPRLIDVDLSGAPVVRGEIIAIDPSPAALEAAQREGFSV